MDNSPLNENDYDNGYSANGIEETSEPIYNNETILSNPIQILLKSYGKNSNTKSIDYEFSIYYRYDNWTVNTSLRQIKEFIKSLELLSYAYLPFEEINVLHKENNLAVVNEKVINLMKYLSYRYDILINPSSIKFFNFNQCSKISQFTKYISNDNLNLLYKFNIETNEQSASDMIYDYQSGVLLLAYEDISLMSSIGRFWSLIDAEALGSLRVYQRLFDDNQKPYFINKITKSFDVRLSKIDINNEINKLFVGFDNGTVHTFNINYIQSTPQSNLSNKMMAISEGIKFKYLIDRITGFCFIENYALISSKENKIIIVQFSLVHPSAIPELSFNASIKKRIEGKGHIDNIKVDHSSLKLYIISTCKVILIYDIIKSPNNMKIAFWLEIDCIDTIQDIYFKADSLFIALKNKIQFFKLDLIENNDSGNSSKDINIQENLIYLDGTTDDKNNYSSKYFNISYKNQIESFCFFGSMQIFIIGLANGTLVTMSSKSLEVIFAKNISQHPIIRLILLEENYVLIVGDKRGTTFFFRFGSQ